MSANAILRTTVVGASASTSWPTIKIGDALHLVNGRAFKPTEWTKTGTPIVRIQNLNNPDAPYNYYQGDLPAKIALDDGDLLFAWSGTPGTSFGAHIWRGGKAWLNQHIFKVEFDFSQFDKRFLQLAINQNLTEYIRAAHGGAGLAHITKGRFEASELPLPPLQEQRRIVAELEKQFTRLEAGVSALRRVQANLKRYRAAVLKAACEGRLVPTEAELAKTGNRKASFETGEALLARILAERRYNWQGRGKYKEPIAADTGNLPSLPEGWTWATPDQLSDFGESAICAGPFGTIFKARDFRPSGVPIIFLRHVAPGRYLAHKPGFMDEAKWEELFRPYSVFGGELLVTKLGEPPGVCAIYPEGIGPAMVTPDVMKMTANSLAALPMFLMHYFNSQTARDFATGVAFGTTRLRLTLPIFREMPVPLPPLAEQLRIVAEVERRLSVVEELEAVVSANLQRASRLRQSILQKAFIGQLVCEDKPSIRQRTG